jgi:hypothetical protein
MEEQLNTPLASGEQTPDFGNSMIDAFKAAMSRSEKKPASQPEPAKSTEPAKETAPAKVSMDMPSARNDLPKNSEPQASDDIPESIKSTKAAEAFRKIKAEREALAKEVEQLRKSGDTGKEYESKLKELQQERETLSERLRLLDIERHPDFVRKYESKLSSVMDNIKSTVGTEGERMVALLKSPDSDYRNLQLDEIIEGLSPAKRAKLGALIVRQEEIMSERNSEIESAKKDYDSVVSQYKKETDDNSAEALQRSEKVWDDISSNARALEVFETRDGDEEWNGEVNQRLSLARQIFNGENSEEDLAKAALWAASAPKYRELLYAQVEVNKRLQAELTRIRGASPEMTNKTVEKTGRSSAPNPTSSDFISSVMKQIR